MPVESKQVLDNCKILFGSRITAGYQAHGLQKQLSEIVVGSSGFKTDVGSRYGISYANSRALLSHKHRVMEVLHEAPASNERAQKLLKLLTDHWEQVRLVAASVVLFWGTVLNPFHSVVSAKVLVGEGKSAVSVTRRKLEAIIDSDLPASNRDAFTILLGYSNEENLSELTKEVLQDIDDAWVSASEPTRKNILSSLINGAKKVQEKFEKDVGLLDDIPDNELMLPLTNRRLVYIIGKFSYNLSIITLPPNYDFK